MKKTYGNTDPSVYIQRDMQRRITKLERKNVREARRFTELHRLIMDHLYPPVVQDEEE